LAGERRISPHNSDIISVNLLSVGVSFVAGMGVRRLRVLKVGLILGAALLTQACSSSLDRMPVQEASEAQRLVFGAPQSVRTQFASQIGACWFGGTGPLKADYTFTMPEADDPSEPALIRIFRTASEREEVFQVQFYPRNDNTVVATRNFELAEDLAKELETSVELWLLDPAQCTANDAALAAPAGETSQSPRAGPSQLDNAERQRQEEIDMHQAELRARGAIE